MSSIYYVLLKDSLKIVFSGNILCQVKVQLFMLIFRLILCTLSEHFGQIYDINKERFHGFRYEFLRHKGVYRPVGSFLSKGIAFLLKCVSCDLKPIG